MKLLSSVFTSTEVLSVSLAALISLKIVRDGGWGWRISWDHQGTLPCDVILVAGQVILRHLDSDRDRECCVIVGDGCRRWQTCDSLLNFTWWKRIGSHFFCFIYTFPPQQTSLTPKCAYTPTFFHFLCLIKPTMPQSMILP